MKRKLIPVLLLIGAMILLSLQGCAAPNTPAGQSSPSSDEQSYSGISVFDAYGGKAASAELFAMDTFMTITCYGPEAESAVRSASEEIRRLDKLLSVGDPNSEIAAINQNGAGTISEETGTMLQQAISLNQSTDGAFDITIYPLMVEWGFTGQSFRVPGEAAIRTLLPLINCEGISISGNRVTLAKGQGIDLGGIAKGYTSGRLMELFASYDLTAALVNLGGNVHCYRSKPDGSPWRCGIQDPNLYEDSSSFLGIVGVTDEAVITSGAYQRYFTDETTGKRYHHILDPKSGYPSESDLISVSIVSGNGMLADGLSTACFIMGSDKSIDYWQANGDDFEMILMTQDNHIIITGGLSARFTSDYPVTVIEKE